MREKTSAHPSAMPPGDVHGRPALPRPDGPHTGRDLQIVRPAAPTRPPLLRFALAVLVLAVIWGMLTDWRVDALVFGVPAVLIGAGFALMLPAAPIWTVSPRAAFTFALWFAAQSVRGAVDVALRAFSPDMRLRPGFRSYPLTLPAGAPRIVFANTITLLPGTMSAEIAGDDLIVHMLDTRADLEAELQELEIRIRALFALPPVSEVSP